MLKYFLMLLLISFELFAKDLEFNPQLLIETEFSQDLNSDLKAGSSALAKMEAGFELCYKEKLTSAVNIEADVESEIVNVQLNEAFLNFTPKSMVSITFGQFVNNFGILESEALSDPLIKGDVETKVPGFQISLGSDKLFGALCLYQGMITENFKAFVPSFGVNLNDKFSAKLSARIEVDSDNTYSDLSFGFAFMPIDFIAFHSELYTELTEKVIEEENFKKLGYFIDFALFPTEKLSFALKFDQLLMNTSDHLEEGDLLLLDFSIGYSIFDPFSITLSFSSEAENIDSSYEWSQALTLNAAVEF